MKNKKMLAMLMALVMTAACVPMTYSTVFASESEQPLEAGVLPAPTGSETPVKYDVEDDNGYLHLYNIPARSGKNNWAAVHYQFPKAVETGVTYRLYYDARLSVNSYEGANAYTTTVQTRTNLGVNGVASNTVLVPNAPTGVGYGQVNSDGVYSNTESNNNYIILTREWQRYSFDMKVTGASVASELGYPYIQMRNKSDYSNFSFDVDNIKLVKVESDGTETPYCDTVTLNGDNASNLIMAQGSTNAAEHNGKFWEGSYIGRSTISPTAADISAMKDFDFYNVPKSADSDKTQINFGNILLDNEHKYTLTVRARVNKLVRNQAPASQPTANATLTYIVGETETILASNVKITSEWTDIAVKNFYFYDNTVIENIICSTNTTESVDFAFELTEVDVDAKNLIDGLDPVTAGTVSYVEVSSNKYIHITERDTVSSGLRMDRTGIGHVHNGGEKIPAGKGLTVKFKARVSLPDDQTCTLYVHSPNFDTKTVTVSNKWQEFTLNVTSKENRVPQFGISCANSVYVPFDLDDIEFSYTDSTGTVVAMACETFDSYEVGETPQNYYVSSWNGNAGQKYSEAFPITVQEDTDYISVAAVSGTDTSLKYELDRTITPGVYTLVGSFRVPVVNNNNLNADDTSIGFEIIALDGQEEIKLAHNTVAINNEWITVETYVSIKEETELSDIIIALGDDLPLDYKDLKFYLSREPDRLPMPVPGITMMLLKKLGAGTTRKVQFIENGGFDIKPVIHDTVPEVKQTQESAGWYYMHGKSTKCDLTYVTENGNSFLRVANIKNEQKGVYWNTGVILQPGTYTLKMDLRVSETAEAENYTAYKWRDEAKNTVGLRVNLHDPNGFFSPQYAAFDPVDRDTKMNGQGNVEGYVKLITRDWTTYTDTIVVDRETLAVFKIGGGTAGAPDCHGFDIDNISISGYVTTGSFQRDDGKAVLEGNATINTIDVEDGNSYLSAHGFDNVSNALVYILPEGKTFEAGKTYRISMDARISVDAESYPYYSIQIPVTFENSEYNLPYASGVSGYDRSENVGGISNMCFQHPEAILRNASNTNAQWVEARKDAPAGWLHYVWEIKIPNSTIIGGNDMIYLRQWQNVRAYPIEIDNFTVTEVGGEGICAFNDFTSENIASTTTDFNKFYLGTTNSKAAVPAIDSTNAQLTAEVETDYFSIGGGTWFRYAGSLVYGKSSEADKYVFKADLRLGYAPNAGGDDSAYVQVTAKINGSSEAIEIGTAEITTKWSGIEFDIPGNVYSVKDLKVTLLDSEDGENFAYDSRLLHFKNVIVEPTNVD